MEGKFELQFEDNEYYLVDGNTNDTVATTDKVLLKKYDGYMKKLSLKNCQAIENGYDLDELVKEQYPIDEPSFKRGFKLALELLGDKKYSEEDMRKALSAGLSIGYGRQFEIENKQIEIDKYIQSLQQTEWDVEIEMWFHGTRHKKGEWIPKLDADGCLILKRK